MGKISNILKLVNFSYFIIIIKHIINQQGDFYETTNINGDTIGVNLCI